MNLMALNQNMILWLWHTKNMVVVMQIALFEDKASYGDVKNDIKGGEQNDPE
jgi:hypothetical protein